MAQVEVKVGMHHYPITCRDGQEAQLLMIAEKLDRRVTALARSLNRGGDVKTIVTASVLMEKEIQDLKNELEQLKEQKQAEAKAAETSRDLGHIYKSLEVVAEMLEKR